MPGWGVTPAIRSATWPPALAFYVDRLGFSLERGGPTDDNSAIARGDARLMLEVAGDLYSPGYNEAIRGRLGTPSAMALYMEAPDLDALYARLRSLGRGDRRPAGRSTLGTERVHRRRPGRQLAHLLAGVWRRLTSRSG